MPAHDSPSLDTLKRNAARLLKGLRSGDMAATRRLAALDNPPPEPQLKHALAVVAREAGFAGWTELKQAREAMDFSEFFAAPGLKDSLNHWFASYEEARAHQSVHGGVLLPYRHQCFVTSLDTLPRLGFEIDDPDWRAIGHDFVRPASPEAKARIEARLHRRFARSC